MARLARVVIPNIPHHITQRGNRGQQTFFKDEDYEFYLSLLNEHCKLNDVEIWCYCLMPNHVHIIAVPEKQAGIKTAISEVHKRYTRMINMRENWIGHLWQGRFHSFPMEEFYLISAARYIELNPVRAGLVNKAEDWKWSSAKAHITAKDNGSIKVNPSIKIANNWQELLSDDSDDFSLLRAHEKTGRPLGSDDFIDECELISGRVLKKKKTGPQKKVIFIT